MWILAVPIVVVVLFLLAVIAAIRKVWWRAAGWLVLCFLLNCWSQTFALHPFFGSVADEKEEGVLRVMTYNVWHGGPYISLHKNDGAGELIDSILKISPDILVLNELSHWDNRSIIDTLSKVFEYNSFDRTDKIVYNSTHVFSRFPIIDCTRFVLPNEKSNKIKSGDWILRLNLGGKIIHLFACHLSSNNDDLYIEHNKNRSIHSFLKSLKYGYKRRSEEVNLICDSIRNISSNVLVAGDFNDIGGSYAVRHVMGKDLADAWWKGGLGYGNTYHGNGLFFRLDHILYSKKDFELLGVKVLNDWKFSDHYPIVADFKLIN